VNGPLCRKCGTDLRHWETPRQRAAKWLVYLVYALVWTSLLAIDLESLIRF